MSLSIVSYPFQPAGARVGKVCALEKLKEWSKQVMYISPYNSGNLPRGTRDTRTAEVEHAPCYRTRKLPAGTHDRAR